MLGTEPGPGPLQEQVSLSHTPPHLQCWDTWETGTLHSRPGSTQHPQCWSNRPRVCKHILWRPASPNLSEPGPLAGQNLPLMLRVALFPPSMSDFLSLFCGWSPPFFSKCFPVYFFPSVPRPHTQVEVFSQMKGRHDWGRWPFSLHGKELSGNCYPAAGRPGSQGGSPWARGPAGKGRLVPHPPESACLPVCSVAFPDLLLPFSSSLEVSTLLHVSVSVPIFLRVFSIVFQSPGLGSPNPPQAIGRAQGGRVLLRGATATPQAASWLPRG